MQNFKLNQPLFDDFSSFYPDEVQEDMFTFLQPSSSDKDYTEKLESEYILNDGRIFNTRETKCPTFPDETKTGTSMGSSFLHEEQKIDDIEENPPTWIPLEPPKWIPFEPKQGKSVTKRPKLEKLPYNYISKVFEGILKRDVLSKRYHEMLKEYFAEPEEFYTWFKGLKYNNVKICKEVWRHKMWRNDDQVNNFKFVLSLITQKFLEKGGADEWIQKSVRVPAYREKYRNFERIILKAMIGKYPEFLSFKMDFD